MDGAVATTGSDVVERPGSSSERVLARHADLLNAVAIALAAIAIYLLTASRDRQQLDYFVRLAAAFLDGRIYLTEAPSWLNELIPAGAGQWYVAYPPMPGILLMPFVLVFGTDFPQQVASCIFGGISVGLAWLVLGEFALTTRVRLLLTAVFGFGTVLWFVSEVGSGWYISHSAAIMFMTAAVLLALRRQAPFAVGLLLGAATLSRLPVGLTAPFFLAMLIDLGWPPRIPLDRRDALSRTIRFGSGLAIPIAFYALYNIARYGTPVDQSYTLIPGVLSDPIYAKDGILSILYIPRHIYAIFLRSWNFVDDPPFFQPSWWGLSLFLTTPVFLWLVRARLSDPRVVWAAIGTALALIPIVTHGNVGISQFGYRFSLDVQPLLLVILATVFERGMSRLAAFASVASIAICAYALWAISIGFVAY
ncbi:MAG TPA: hypothetical protein VEG29_03885 [Candidatus Binatia bacterium]|nr:hypothetical protein [Candidatus Binatia bacterium]